MWHSPTLQDDKESHDKESRDPYHLLVNTPTIIHVTQFQAQKPSQKQKSDDNTALSNVTLLAIYCVIISDSIALTVMTPFITQYCRDWLHLPESQIDNASGWLLGSFSFAVFLSSFFLGHVSDRYGRKPLILMGLITSVIGTIGFAITQNVWIALAFRIFSGLTNANIALCRAVITDVTTNAESRAMAFAYQGASFSVARALASGVGGLAAGINIFKYDNPFFLPCLIGALFNLITLFISWIYIPETLNENKRKSTKTLKHVFIDLGTGLSIIWHDSLLRKLIFVQALNAYSNGALLLLFVLHCSLEIAKGGLDWSFLWTGLLYSWFGICAVVFQLVVYKRAHKRFSLTSIYRCGCVCLGVACLAFPFPAMMYHRDPNMMTTTNQVIIVLLMGIICLGLAAGFMTAMPVVGTMVSNACDPNRQGLTLGTTQSIQSLLRGLGPLTAGTFFTFTANAFDMPWIPFVGLAVVNVVCFVIMCTLSEEEHELIKAPRPKTILPQQAPLIVTSSLGDMSPPQLVTATAPSAPSSPRAGTPPRGTSPRRTSPSLRGSPGLRASPSFRASSPSVSAPMLGRSGRSTSIQG